MLDQGHIQLSFAHFQRQRAHTLAILFQSQSLPTLQEKKKKQLFFSISSQFPLSKQVFFFCLIQNQSLEKQVFPFILFS